MIWYQREGSKIRVLGDEKCCDMTLNELAFSHYRATMIGAGYQVEEAAEGFGV